MLPALPRWLGTACVAALCGVPLAGCDRGPATAQAPAAAKPADESNLGKVTLSPEQAHSLAIKSEPARSAVVQETRQLYGWVIARQGNEVTVTAPVAGTVRDPRKPRIPLLGRLPDVMPLLGRKVVAGQELLVIDPVLSPLEQVQLAALKATIDSELKKARENRDIAKSEFDRTNDLHKISVKTDQELELAKTKYANAEADLTAAILKQDLFSPDNGSTSGLAKLPPVPVVAPRSAGVLAVPVSPGQYVTAGPPPDPHADPKDLCLRVPVPEYELPRVKQDEPATVRLPAASAEPLEAKDGAGTRKLLKAEYETTVNQVDPIRHTADVIYKLPKDSPLVKDQMVSVFVPLGKKQKESVVPYSAIVFDAYRGSWIYLDRTGDAKGPHVYERRRVELGPATTGDDVVIRPALGANDRVVVDGAAKLFSAEFFKPPMKTK